MKQLRPGDRLLRGKSVRLIDQNNQQLGIMSFEAAMAKAQQADLDLVLVPSRAEPPVTRIMDFGKYQFDEAKRAREAKRQQVQPKLKEIKLHANIDDNDFQIKCRHAIDFLTHGDKVRLLLVYRGRELAHQELGMEVLNRFIAQLETVATQDGAPKRMGKSVTTVFTVKPQCRIAKPAAKPAKDSKEPKDAKAEGEQEGEAQA
ncbi:MAG: translation initiation factor IF-3 [Desulfovibrio sp.]|nr:translation initiation factor IF-3 [Desulfovibrio sp.]